VKNPGSVETQQRHSKRRAQTDRRSSERIKTYLEAIESDHTLEQFTLDITQYENKSPSKHTILVCEDTPGQLNLLIDCLHAEYNLLFASNGIQGLEKLNRFSAIIDCILSDVKMPDMDGLEFCQNVFSQESNKHIPFIFITALYNDHEQIKGLSYGATDYLQKPFNAAILREKLNHWISQREHERILLNLIESLETKNNEISKLRSIVSHEIKNPLQVLSFSIQAVKKLVEKFYPLSDEEFKDYWNRLSHINSVYESINTVLDTAKAIESDINAANTKHEFINTLFNDSLTQTQHHLSTISISVDTVFNTEDTVWCDKKMLNQVFVNMIRNASEAIKERYKEGGGEIKITLSKDKYNRFRIEIRDNGIGISSDGISKLFMYKHTTKKDGTGIGLYLSKKILRLHGGDIIVSSEENKGTTFSIILPLQQDSGKKEINLLVSQTVRV
jgi:signal transduction histidine kinase